MFVDAGHDHVAALDHARVVPGTDRRGFVQEPRDPGARRIRDCASADGPAGSIRMDEARGPGCAVAAQRLAARARHYDGTTLLRVESREHDEPRIVDPRVRIGEAAGIAPLERRAGRMGGEVDGLRSRQPATPRQMVVEEETGADHPCRAQVAVVRQHEAQRPDDVRGGRDEDLALAQRLAHEPEVVVLEVAQAAVDELGAAGRGVGREVVLLAQQHREPAAGGIAGDARAVDAAADDEQVEAVWSGVHVARVSGRSSRTRAPRARPARRPRRAHRDPRARPPGRRPSGAAVRCH